MIKVKLFLSLNLLLLTACSTNGFSISELKDFNFNFGAEKAWNIDLKECYGKNNKECVKLKRTKEKIDRRINNYLIRSDLPTLKEFAEAIEDKSECSLFNGKWKNIGGRNHICVLNTNDGGSECSGNWECEGLCITNDSVNIGDKAVGQCAETTHLKGCNPYLSDGKVEGIVCFN